MINKMKSNKSKFVVIVLVVLLLIAVGYIIYDKVQQRRQTQLLTALQQGYNQGIYGAVLSLYQQTEKCQVTTITLGNLTRQVVDVACIQQASK